MERVAAAKLGTWRDIALPLPALPLPALPLPALPLHTLGARLVARVWSPAGGADRMLVAHDGPDYERFAGLGAFTAASIAAGRVAPYHLVLLPAMDRSEWYSASPAYARTLHSDILPRLAAELGTDRPVVGAGASLGALAMLHAQRRHPADFAGLLLQSGSFFQPRFDSQESGFARWLRIVRFVGRVRRAADGPAVPVVLTCGADEENLANNRDLARVLAGQRYPVTFAAAPGGHDWGTWKAALETHLISLLNRAWP